MRHFLGSPLQRLGLTLAVLVLTSVLLATNLFDPFEDRLTNVRANWIERAPTGQIAIVEIDARSLSELPTWPWSRQYHAQLITNAHAAGADMIAFDVDFSALSEPVHDRAFAEALRTAEPVILPIYEQRASSQSANGAVITSKPAELFSAAWTGGVNIFPDSDGTVREYAAATIIHDRIQPSIATILAQNTRMGDQSFQPDWGIIAQNIPRISYVDLMNGRVPENAIAGKRLLIGATAIELGDRYVVPRYGILPGVVIQALAAESLLQNRAILRTGIVPTLLGVAIVALLLGVPNFGHFPVSFGLASVLTIAALITLPVILQAWWPVSMESVAMIFAAFLCIASRTGAEIHRHVAVKSLSDNETGLPNRLELEAHLDQLDQGAIVAIAAIERYEVIRDTIGTRGIAEIVKETAHRISEGGTGPVFRIAPDMLAWIYVTEADREIDGKIDALSNAFRAPICLAEEDVDIALSIGLDRKAASSVAVLPIEHAIAAVGTAREAGEIYNWYGGINPDARRKLSLMGEMRQGMVRGDLNLVYQPKLDLRDGRIADAEALLRWHHPVDGMIPPDMFIPLAESTGVVRELTEFVLHRAVSDCARLKAKGIEMRVAVNLSARDIVNPYFVKLVLQLLEKHDLEPSRLTLEITEGAIIRSPEAAIETLTQLRAAGLHLSIDDYGTGQSTLSYLKQLPVHELKIDKSFVTSLCHSRNDLIMVRSTIELAHELGLEVVAEGIEDAPTMQLLAELGCDYLQGYLIGKPMPISDLCEIARSGRDYGRVAA
ncbi:putative bifunctional diguanylate cyclase/phosphodiesterase [Parasphingorhabdus sp.]|uniref:putative bifunctional diguanylate cyclase/phosphodiesterase n=1 Tax=Parasphingorhabdus sp. TaxID=2709688 RepID=UPI003C70BEDC